MYLSIIKITLLNLKVTLTENNRTVIYLCTLMMWSVPQNITVTERDAPLCGRILSDTNYMLTHEFCTATTAATVLLSALVLSPPHSYSTFEPSSWHGEPSTLQTLRLTFCRCDSIVVIYFLEEAMKPCG